MLDASDVHESAAVQQEVPANGVNVRWRTVFAATRALIEQWLVAI
jgi:hypothetical protein